MKKRVSLLALSVPLLLTSCSGSGIPATIGGPVPTTAIYAPPVRLGGRGGILFIPGGAVAAAASDRDSVAVLEALHRKMAAKGEAACINPILVNSVNGAGIRQLVAESLGPQSGDRPTDAQVRGRIIAGERGNWAMVDEPAINLSGSVETQVIEAYADIAMRDRSARQTRLLRASDIPAARIEAGCERRLSRPAIIRDWAFVRGIPTRSATRLHALRRDVNGWTLVATRPAHAE